MKKIYVTIFTLGQMFLAQAQQAFIDFESLTLPSVDTFYNGADNAGGFTIQTGFGNSLDFSNVYTQSQWGDYWNGFSYSNVSDNTTAGYENQYSAITGSGASNSNNYLVYYPDGTLSFSFPTIIDSLKITNSTYAALSMLNGDMFAKKFGESVNANGDVDGTNGEDFFKIWFVGMDANGNRLDSVEFYLADYRFSDNTQDYIIDTWENVYLGNLGVISKLTMRFESSDMSFGYINTPQYVAIDNISISNTLKVNLIDEKNIKLFPNPASDFIQITGEKINSVEIFNLNGKKIASFENENKISLASIEKGNYILRINNLISRPFIKL